MLRVFCAIIMVISSCVSFSVTAAADINIDDDLMMNLPFAGGVPGEADVSLCPEGARVVTTFLAAWEKGEYQIMYSLIDKDDRADYTFEEARLDFQFIPYKKYIISSVQKSGDDYEFLLSSGNWKDGDKDVKKMVVNGTNFLIRMPARNSFFKVSIDSYF